MVVSSPSLEVSKAGGPCGRDGLQRLPAQEQAIGQLAFHEPIWGFPIKDTGVVGHFLLQGPHCMDEETEANRAK